MNFGEALRTMREEAGMTRRDLEDATGISQRHIAYLESGEKEPGRLVLQSLTEVFGPGILEAAFPELVGLTGRRRRRATARYLSGDDGPTPDGSFDLALASP